MRAQDSTNREAYLAVLNFLKLAYHKGCENLKPQEWEDFCGKLKEISLSEDDVKTVSFWTMDNLASHEPSRVQPRALQEFEAQIFPGESHSEFVEAVLFGMISEIQGECILDEFMDTPVPTTVEPDRMLSSLTLVWGKNIKGYKVINVN